MALEKQNQTIDLQWCRSYLSDKIFKLRPEDYQKEHPIWPGMVGIEIEMMPLDESLLSSTGAMIPLLGDGSLQSNLKNMLPENRLWQPQGTESVYSSIKLEDEDQLTFEPGGQLEYSSKPYPCLDDACKRTAYLQKTLNSHFSKQGVRFLQMGSHPWQSAEDIGLQMTKPRYQAMNKYFTRIGPFGKRMMRETCTIQVNLDFGGSEEKMAKRFLVANLMAPVLTAMFAHSPVSEGRPNGFKSVRAHIWQNLDRGRTGFPKLSNILEAMDQKSCVDSYLDMVLDANVVFVEGQDFAVPESDTSFRSWVKDGIDGVYPSEDDFVTHLSLHFPEVRARGFMEIRSIDSQAPAWQLAPACLLTGVLYNDDSLEQAFDLLVGQIGNIEELWAASTKGLENLVLHDFAAKIMYLALQGFSKLPSCYEGKGRRRVLERFNEHFTSKGRCPADDILDALEASGEDQLSAEVLFKVQDKWLKLVS